MKKASKQQVKAVRSKTFFTHALMYISYKPGFVFVRTLLTGEIPDNVGGTLVHTFYPLLYPFYIPVNTFLIPVKTFVAPDKTFDLLDNCFYISVKADDVFVHTFFFPGNGFHVPVNIFHAPVKNCVAPDKTFIIPVEIFVVQKEPAFITAKSDNMNLNTIYHEA